MPLANFIDNSLTGQLEFKKIKKQDKTRKTLKTKLQSRQQKH